MKWYFASRMRHKELIGNIVNFLKTKIYAVGKFNDRSLMHFHPAIKRVDKLSDVFSIKCPELLTQGDAALLASFDPHITGI